MKTRVEFKYREDGAGSVSVMANAWIGEPENEAALGPWYSEEYEKKRVALEDLVEVLLNEIVSGHLRFQLASNGGYFERPQPQEEEQDRVLGKMLRQLEELMEENTRLDGQLQEALKGNTKMSEDNKNLREQFVAAKAEAQEQAETKRLLREAYAKIERQGGRLAQIRAITERQ